MYSINIFNRDVISIAELTMNAYDAIILAEPIACDSFAIKCDINVLLVAFAGLVSYLFASSRN